MNATILVVDRDLPPGFEGLPANPIVFLITPPNKLFPPKEYSDNEVAGMMLAVKITPVPFQTFASRARLAVVNYHVKHGFRLIAPMPLKLADGRSAVEFYMEMPPDFSKNHEA